MTFRIPMQQIPADIAAKARPCPHSVPLVRRRVRQRRRHPLRTFCIVLAAATLGWALLLWWGAHDFRAAYGDKQLKGCALVGEKLRCW